MQDMANASPGTQSVQPCPLTKTWIEVVLVDEDGDPVPHEKYAIKLPDGSTQTGCLDEQGKVKFENITGGQAMVNFPDIDAREWKHA